MLRKLLPQLNILLVLYTLFTCSRIKRLTIALKKSTVVFLFAHTARQWTIQLTRTLLKDAFLKLNLSPSLRVCSCITNDNQITLSLVREKIESRGNPFWGNNKSLQHSWDWDAEKYLLLFEYFQLFHIFTRKNEMTETNPSTYAQVVNPSSSDPGWRKFTEVISTFETYYGSNWTKCDNSIRKKPRHRKNILKLA